MNKIRSCILLFLALLSFDALAISAPSITSCTRLSETSVRIVWTSVSGAVQYRVAQQHGAYGTWYYDTTTATSFTDTYANAEACSYYVIAIDSSGASAQSSTASVSAYNSGSGGGSSGGSFTINASDGTSTEGVIITWTAQSGVTGYRVVRGNTSNMDNASILVETVTGTSYTDTTAAAGKTYYYWIVAKKSSGYVTSSYNTGYRASSSSGGGSGSGSGSGSGTSYDGQSYTVKFNANGGTGTMANESFVYGTAKALTINTFTKTGYTFVGWAKSSSATTSVYDDGEEVSNLTTTSGGTVNLYAVWQANSYTIKFNKNGGSGSMSNLSMTYGTAKALTANAFQRVNYRFIGWATTSSATTATYTDKQSVNNLTSTPDAVVNLYAVWKLVLEVTSVTARQRYPWNGLVDIDVTFSAGGLSKVFFEIKDTAGNTNLNARTFYVGNPEQNNRTLEVQPGTHRFVWDAFADLGQVTLSSFAVSAKVVEKLFQVNVTGGTGSGSFVQGDSASLTAASKTGYTFASWSGTSADTGLLASATSASTTLTIPSRDVAYEATYTPNTYTVKFNANGGSGSMPVESFTYDVSKALTANAFTRNGWNFLGWADSATATTAKYTNGQSVKNLAAAGTKNLYAVWEAQGVQLWEGGPYWSKNNLGATTPQGTGYFFWWGDTVGYKRVGSSWNAVDGSVTGFSFTSANCATYGKTLSQLQSAGYINSEYRLVAMYDAATKFLGAPWRIPTTSDFYNLKENTTYTRTTRNGVEGWLFTGKGNYSSKSIFIPFAGHGSGTSFSSGWTSSEGGSLILGWCSGLYSYTGNTSSSYAFCWMNKEAGSETTLPLSEWYLTTAFGFSRFYGFQIRPVISGDQ